MAKSSSQRRRHTLRAVDVDTDIDETTEEEVEVTEDKPSAVKKPAKRRVSAPKKVETEDEDEGLAEGYFVGPVDSMGRREWQAPEVIQGHPASGVCYEFSMLNGEDYSRFMKGGIGNILENPTELDPIIANQSYVNPKVDLREISFWELEALRGAYLMFLINGD